MREWLGDEWEERDAIVEHEALGDYLAWWWDDGACGARVEIVLTPAVGRTPITVTELPITTPMALARA